MVGKNIQRRLMQHWAEMILVSIFFLVYSHSISAQALTGTYTIGATNSNYTSFTAAAKGLTTNGVSGPVTFNVAPGNYNESITMPAISGASAINTITFKGAGMGSGGTRIY